MGVLIFFWLLVSPTFEGYRLKLSVRFIKLGHYTCRHPVCCKPNFFMQIFDVRL